MPIKVEPRLVFWTRAEAHSGQFTSESYLTVRAQAFLDDPEFFESRWKIECDDIFKQRSIHRCFNFKSHWDIRATAREIARHGEIVNMIYTASNCLKNAQRSANRGFTGAVLANE